MRTVDNIMKAENWAYYRYMDDIRIKCSSLHDARRSLVCLTEALRTVGLSLNAKKTRIHEEQIEGAQRAVRPGTPAPENP